MALEALGRPTVLVATAPFAGLARQLGASYGMPDLRLAVVEHPLGGVADAAVVARAEGVVEQVLRLLTRPA